MNNISLKIEVIKKIKRVFNSYAYDYIESPVIEHTDLFYNKHNLLEMYKFFDKNGLEMTLRSSMTHSIIKAAEKEYLNIKKPLRFSYIGNIFKYNDDCYEFTQMGIELIGIDSEDADAETIAVAVKSILSVGLHKFKIVIGQADLLKFILKEAGLCKQDFKRLQEFVIQKNYFEAEKLIKKNNINKNMKALFLKIPRLSGNISIIKYAQKFIQNKDAFDLLERIKKVYEVLKLYNVDKYVFFDLSMESNNNDYTDIIFKVYTDNSSYPVIEGGRCKQLETVGFGIKINNIIDAVRYYKIDLKLNNTKYLFSFKNEGKETAFKTADKYRGLGLFVENSLLGEDLNKNIEYAKQKGMSHVLYFFDNLNIRLVSLLDDMGGYSVDITVNDLIEPQKEY